MEWFTCVVFFKQSRPHVQYFYTLANDHSEAAVNAKRLLQYSGELEQPYEPAVFLGRHKPEFIGDDGDIAGHYKAIIAEDAAAGAAKADPPAGSEGDAGASGTVADEPGERWDGQS